MKKSVCIYECVCACVCIYDCVHLWVFPNGKLSFLIVLPAWVSVSAVPDQALKIQESGRNSHYIFLLKIQKT